MKKIKFLCLFLSLWLLISGLSASINATESNLAVTNGCHSLDAAMTLSEEQKLAETAKAVVLYELNSGTLLYTYNPDARIYPTSMVKMMTTLVALEHGDLDEIVTVRRSVLNQLPVGIISSGLKAGEEISLRDLLYCTMVESSNDAATVVANHIAESAEVFVMMMNEKAAELGCRDTHYSNVHGLHDENSYTTARDVARLTEAALQNETFRTMFETKVYTVPETNRNPERVIYTSNHMMSDTKVQKFYDERVTGGKTGATDEGGRCLTLTAQSNGMNILCVLMGAVPTKSDAGNLIYYGNFEESKVLIDYAFESFEFRQVFFEGQSLAQYPVSNGANDVVTQTTASVSTILPVGVNRSELRWVYQPGSSVITAPVQKGQSLGIAEVWYGNKCLAQADMVAMSDVQIKQVPIIPEKPEGNGDGRSWKTLLFALLGITAAGFLLFIGIRSLQIMHYQRRKKHKRGKKHEQMG